MDMEHPHEYFMRRCLQLAERGRGRVGNGALVGAVLVRDGAVIAEGWHAGFGELHAERALLQSFQGEVRSTDILYVNLEPCCHTGKTPPCTDIILQKGVRTVVYGLRDPDPRVAGQGIELLRSRGVTVIGPVARASCEYLNRGFLSVHTRQRPWITLKSARTRSGAIANSDGSRLKISSEKQDQWSHTMLRQRTDAILVGVGTILRDNPKLNTRFAQKIPQELGLHQPWRIVLDPMLRIPMDARIVTDEAVTRTMILTTPDAGAERRRELEKRGVSVRSVPLANGTFSFDALWKVLLTPVGSYIGLTSILVEGGAKTWEIFRTAKCLDEEVCLVGAS